MAGLPRMAGRRGGPDGAAPAAVDEGGAPPEPLDLADAMDRFETPLLRYVGNIVSQAEDAQDIVQEVFLRYCRCSRAGGAAEVRNVSSWLFSVAHNLAQDCLRRRCREREAQRQAGAEPAPAEAAAERDAVDHIIRQAASERALAELRQLPEEYRQLLLLRIIQDMTFRDIARVTGLTFGNVAYRINQGLKELARRLREAGVV